jgi:hypothetical protein
MIGRFLELSVHAPDVLQSVRFYELLGLRPLSVGETWSHPYAVMSDGRAFIGLHGYEFDSPAVTFVLRNLARKQRHLEQQGIRFAFAKTGDDEFNEAGFVTPAGLMVALLEARTYSPPDFDSVDFSRLGRCAGLIVPAADLASERDFWSNLGLRVAREYEEPYPHATLSAEGITVAVHERPGQRETALQFICPDLGALAMALDDADIPWRQAELPHAAQAIRLQSPEGLALVIQGG